MHTYLVHTLHVTKKDTCHIHHIMLHKIIKYFFIVEASETTDILLG